MHVGPIAQLTDLHCSREQPAGTYIQTTGGNLLRRDCGLLPLIKAAVSGGDVFSPPLDNPHSGGPPPGQTPTRADPHPNKPGWKEVLNQSPAADPYTDMTRFFLETCFTPLISSFQLCLANCKHLQRYDDFSRVSRETATFEGVFEKIFREKEWF